MSERKVLNVSSRNSCILIEFIVLIPSNSLVEILPAGFRSVQDPAGQATEESPVHGPADGPVQHAVRNVRRVHLQGQKVQRPQGGRRERGLPRHPDLPVLHQVYALPAGDFLQNGPAQHRLRDRGRRDSQLYGAEAGGGAGPTGGGGSPRGGGHQSDEAAGEPDAAVAERDRAAGVAGGAAGFEPAPAGRGL